MILPSREEIELIIEQAEEEFHEALSKYPPTSEQMQEIRDCGARLDEWRDYLEKLDALGDAKDLYDWLSN